MLTSNKNYRSRQPDVRGSDAASALQIQHLRSSPATGYTTCAVALGPESLLGSLSIDGRAINLSSVSESRCRTARMIMSLR